MGPLRRRFVIAGIVILVALLGLLTATSLWLRAWVSTKGKGWLETQLEQSLPLDVTIGTMRYSLVSGLLLENVSAVDRQTQTTWFHAPTLSVRIGLLGLIIQQRLAFHLTGTVEAPCTTDLVASGRYHLRSRQLTVDVLTSSIPLDQVSPQLAQRLPPALKAGQILLKFRASWQPGVEPMMTGQIKGTGLLWKQGPIRITSNVTIDGTATSTPQGPKPLSMDLTIRMDQGSLVGLPILIKASEVSGVMHLANDVLTIDQVRGTTLGSPWQLEGTVVLLAEPQADLMLRTHVDLATVASQIHQREEFARTWQPNGELELVLVCRGPLRQWPNLELMAKAIVQEASLAIPMVPHRLEQLTGSLQYDHLTKRVIIESLTGRMHQEPVTLSGVVQLDGPAPRLAGELRLAGVLITVRTTWHPDRLAVDAAELAIGDSRLRARGEVGRLPRQVSQLNVMGTIDPSDLSQLPWVNLKALESWQPDGNVALQLRLLGPFDDWQRLEAFGVVQSDQLVLRTVPIHAVSAELEQGQGRLSIRVTNAVFAGGRLSGGYLIEHAEPAKNLLEFDLIAADLAQLATSIPAWRAHDLQGRLSAHASLIGQWGDPNARQGLGWVQATGERLADLPLLNRVLPGLFGVLADRLGLGTLRTARVTEVAGQWRISQGRVFTDDLRLSAFAGTEPLTISVRGSVGFDKTLDLTVEPELSEQLVLEAPNTSALASAVFKTAGGIDWVRRRVGRHHLGGTIDNPEYKFEVSLEQLLENVIRYGIERLFRLRR